MVLYWWWLCKALRARLSLKCWNADLLSYSPSTRQITHLLERTGAQSKACGHGVTCCVLQPGVPLVLAVNRRLKPTWP